MLIDGVGGWDWYYWETVSHTKYKELLRIPAIEEAYFLISNSIPSFFPLRHLDLSLQSAEIIRHAWY